MFHPSMTFESLLYSKEIKQVNPKGNQSWIFIGRTDAETEAPILWPPNAKSQLIGKDPDAGKDRRPKEKGTTEHEMVGWHHWLNGREFEQTPGDSEGQGSLECFSPWGCKELDTTEQLNNSNHHRKVGHCCQNDPIHIVKRTQNTVIISTFFVIAKEWKKANNISRGNFVKYCIFTSEISHSFLCIPRD